MMFKSFYKKVFSFILLGFSISNIIAVIVFSILLRKFESNYVSCNCTFNFDQYLSVHATQYSLLQIYFIIFSLILAVLAFFGFSAIKSSSEQMAKNIAEKKSEEVYKKVIDLVKELIKDKKDFVGQPSHNANEPIDDEYITEVTSDDE